MHTYTPYAYTPKYTDILIFTYSYYLHILILMYDIYRQVQEHQ